MKVTKKITHLTVILCINIPIIMKSIRNIRAQKIEVARSSTKTEVENGSNECVNEVHQVKEEQIYQEVHGQNNEGSDEREET